MTVQPDFLPVPYVSAEDWERERQARERARMEEEFGREADVLERMQKAYEMHLADIPTREIGRRLGVSHMTAWRDIRDYKMYSARSLLNPVEYLGAQLAECSTMRTALWRDMRLRAVDSPAAVRALLKVQEREGKLLDLVAFAAKVDEYELMSDEELDELG